MWPLLHRPSPVGALSEQYCKAIPKPDVFHRRRQKMAPEAISPFLQPLPFSHRHLPKLPRRLPLPLITCRSGQSGPDGSGPASPTRGQVFIERQGSVRAAKLLMKEFNKDQKRDRAAKDKASKVTSSAAPSCYGCGAPLQTSESDAPGYVDRDTFELKKKHHQLRTLICRRCQLLSHGHMITAVGGNGGYPGGKQFVTAEELREKLSYLRREKALIVKLVDIVDFNGSFLSRIRDLVGANPIILVVTKVDLLPKGTDFNCIGDWIVESTVKKKLNVTSVHLTSAKSLVGITGVVSEIQKEKKGRDVYILGSANVGKSAFISALLRLMAEKDPIAAAAQRYKPVESAVPGTTLGPIQIDAFFGGGRLYDTPGVHLYHRQAAVVHVKDLPALAPLNRLKGQKFALTTMGDQYSSMNGLSIFWGGLVRIDLLKVPPGTHLTFYGPKALQIHAVPSNKADKFYQTNLGGLLTPPTGMDGAKDWRGLDQERRLLIKYDELDRPACDVAISGLGWVAIEPKSCGNPESVLEEEEKEFHFSVRVPRPVEIFVRTPMPVGKTGAEWYQYRELTDKEAESRPKWNF